MWQEFSMALYPGKLITNYYDKVYKIVCNAVKEVCAVEQNYNAARRITVSHNVVS